MNNTTFLQQQLNILRQQAKALAEQIESMQFTLDTADTPLPPIKEAEVSGDLISVKPQQQKQKDLGSLSRPVVCIRDTRDVRYKSCSAVKPKHTPEQVRQFVDTYNELAKTGTLSRSKIVCMIVERYKLDCSPTTVHNAIFYHSTRPGYEDIPTPPLQKRPEYSVTKNEKHVKAAKWLMQHGLNNSVIGRMLGVAPSCISAIRSNMTHTEIELTDADDKRLHKVYDQTLKEMGIRV